VKDALLQAHGISVHRNGRVTLKPCDLAVDAGETVAIYGPNGAGKSTLIQALAGLLPLASGKISLAGQLLGRDLSLFHYHRRIAVVFQEPLLLRGTVGHNVGVGLRLRGVPRQERGQRIGPLLDQLKIAHLVDRPAGMLSGGEAQRTSLARALVLEPDVLFLDEPFAALDQPTRVRLVRELAGLLRERRMATLFVTHDLSEAAALCTRCVVVDAGEILQQGTFPEVLNAPGSQRVAEITNVENDFGVRESAGEQ